MALCHLLKFKFFSNDSATRNMSAECDSTLVREAKVLHQVDSGRKGSGLNIEVSTVVEEWTRYCFKRSKYEGIYEILLQRASRFYFKCSFRIDRLKNSWIFRGDKFSVFPTMVSTTFAMIKPEAVAIPQIVKAVIAVIAVKELSDIISAVEEAKTASGTSALSQQVSEMY
ncbi:unnamed protein product [Enterobius vermicularis]|uniref:Band_3_cyto domain-containing protein n=1 Tax=Enterobius vermicularis TaxID=51028 RepID=A0A0N4VD14_ENTVE|nr:unnamed protein product [Enterobius vermicularis]